MNNPIFERGRYVAPVIEDIEFLVREDILAGASNYQEKPIDWDEYWGDGNN